MSLGPARWRHSRCAPSILPRSPVEGAERAVAGLPADLDHEAIREADGRSPPKLRNRRSDDVRVLHRQMLVTQEHLDRRRDRLGAAVVDRCQHPRRFSQGQVWHPGPCRDERLGGRHLLGVIASDEPDQHVRVDGGMALLRRSTSHQTTATRHSSHPLRTPSDRLHLPAVTWCSLTCRLRIEANSSRASSQMKAVRAVGHFADSIRARLIEVTLGDVRRVEVDHRSSRSSDWYTAESTGTFDRSVSPPRGWGEAGRSRMRQMVKRRDAATAIGDHGNARLERGEPAGRSSSLQRWIGFEQLPRSSHCSRDRYHRQKKRRWHSCATAQSSIVNTAIGNRQSPIGNRHSVNRQSALCSLQSTRLTAPAQTRAQPVASRRPARERSRRTSHSAGTARSHTTPGSGTGLSCPRSSPDGNISVWMSR